MVMSYRTPARRGGWPSDRTKARWPGPLTTTQARWWPQPVCLGRRFTRSPGWAAATQCHRFCSACAARLSRPSLMGVAGGERKRGHQLKESKRMRPNGRPMLAASELAPNLLMLSPGYRPVLACPDCETWRVPQRGMLPAHRAADGVTRCAGSGQRVTIDLTPAEWQRRLDAAVRDAALRRGEPGAPRRLSAGRAAAVPYCPRNVRAPFSYSAPGRARLAGAFCHARIPGHGGQHGHRHTGGRPLPRPAWPASPATGGSLALCAQVDPDLFFPDKGESPRPAKRVCASCEVRAECLQDALDRGSGSACGAACPNASAACSARQPKPHRVRYCPAHGVALSGGPVLYHCPVGRLGHGVTAADLDQAAEAGNDAA